MYRFIASLIFLLGAVITCTAQSDIYSPYNPAYQRFDSLVKASVAAYPNAGLFKQLTLAYEALHIRPNPALLPLDTIADKARMDTETLLSSTVGRYEWQGVYDSLHFNITLGDVLPAVAAYDAYLCNCIAFNSLNTPYQQYGKVLRKHIDSCRTNVHTWSGWADYKRLADSVGIAKIRGKSQDAYTAYLLKTCNTFKEVVRQGLPFYVGYSPGEQLITRLNDFHTRIAEAVKTANATLATPYASSATLKSLQAYFNDIRTSLSGKQVVVRMSFYNNTGKFYFLLPANGRMQVYSVLSYDFTYADETFRMSNLKYKLRKVLEQMDTNDEFIFQHLFRYPLIPLGKYGMPLNNPIPRQNIIRTSYFDDLKGVDLTPPVE